MPVSTQKTLVGWKAIASYFSRDERTVMRWAATRGMPVQRVAGQARSSVYAWPEDLDAWLRQPSAEDAAAEPASAATETNPGAPTKPRWPGVKALPWRDYRMLVAILLAVLAIIVVANASGMLRRHSARDAIAGQGDASIPAFHDPKARALYLQAMFDWNLRTRDSLLRAISEFGDAAAREPGVVASYVGIANSYLLLREYGAMPDDQAYARAYAAAKIAIQLDPRSTAARRSLAFIAFWWRGDIATAGREFAAALKVDPSDALTHHWFATALLANGEMAAALREITTARALDPTSSSTLTDYALIAYLAGHRADSASVFRSLAEVDGQDASLHRALGEIALFEGRYRDYLTEAARAATLRGDTATQARVASEADDFVHGGAPLMFEHMVDAARNITRRTNSGFFDLARVSAISGRTVAAIDAIAPACTQHERDAIAAPGDLWLSRAVPADTIKRLCGRPSLEQAANDAYRSV